MSLSLASFVCCHGILSSAHRHTYMLFARLVLQTLRNSFVSVKMRNFIFIFSQNYLRLATRTHTHIRKDHVSNTKAINARNFYIECMWTCVWICVHVNFRWRCSKLNLFFALLCLATYYHIKYWNAMHGRCDEVCVCVWVYLFLLHCMCIVFIVLLLFIGFCFDYVLNLRALVRVREQRWTKMFSTDMIIFIPKIHCILLYNSSINCNLYFI